MLRLNPNRAIFRQQALHLRIALWPCKRFAQALGKVSVVQTLVRLLQGPHNDTLCASTTPLSGYAIQLSKENTRRVPLEKTASCLTIVMPPGRVAQKFLNRTGSCIFFHKIFRRSSDKMRIHEQDFMCFRKTFKQLPIAQIF